MLLSRFIITGHSMEPNLPDKSFAFVSSIPYFFSKPKVGDIIAFKKKGKIFIKRISKIDREKYFAKGDNNSDSLDSNKLGWVLKKEILGKLIVKI